MPDGLHISLRYNGKDVDEGTMPIDEVIDSLQGFSSAYSKIANRRSGDAQHQLRVAAVKTGSSELLILAYVVLQQNAPIIDTVKVTIDAVRWVVGKISGVIAAKKHIQGMPYQVSVTGNDNTVILANFEGAQMAVTPDVLEILKDRLIDSDLNKIAAPLNTGTIDSVEILADDQSATITSQEKEFFRPDATVSTTREMEIEGKFVSLNKESSRGSLKLGNGTNVRYHYIGNDKYGFHRDFARKGPVKVVGDVTFDANLTVQHVDVKSVTYLQSELPFSSS